jgi:hypothetical protein
MSKFKIKLNQPEMKFIAGVCMAVAAGGDAWMPQADQSVMMLAMNETCERLWSRLRNMYRPDRDRYTVQLNAIEVTALTNVVTPLMREADNPGMRSIGYAMDEELRKQIEREVNIYNAMHHGNA